MGYLFEVVSKEHLYLSLCVLACGLAHPNLFSSKAKQASPSRPLFKWVNVFRSKLICLAMKDEGLIIESRVWLYEGKVILLFWKIIPVTWNLSLLSSLVGVKNKSFVTMFDSHECNSPRSHFLKPHTKCGNVTFPYNILKNHLTFAPIGTWSWYSVYFGSFCFLHQSLQWCCIVNYMLG